MAHRRVDLDRGEWPSAWLPALEELKAPLGECVSHLGCAGMPAAIVYSLPGTFVNVHSCPAGAGRWGAAEAAKLALASLATFPLDSNPHGMTLLHADRPGSKDDQAPLRLHMLSAADHDGTIAALTAWAASAGLNVTSVTPAEAVLNASAVALAMSAGPLENTATLWIGAHQSVLAVSLGHRLELVRTIATGTETLVDALLRPIRRRGEGEPVTLDRATARRLLASVGIPCPQQPLPEMPGFDGACILPFLQPALQRLAVEIKQSLRFGVGEALRGSVKLHVAGEGAATPNLGDVLSRQAAFAPASSDAEHGSTPSVCSAAPRLTEQFLRMGETPICLLGLQAADDMALKGLRRTLLAGVTAAAALLTVQGLSARAALNEEQKRLDAIKSVAAGTQALAGVQDRALAAKAATAAIDQRIAAAMGQAPDWATFMAVIAERTPASMRIVDAGMSTGQGRATCALRGYVRIDETPDAPGEIRRFVETLSREPIVESVKLGATQRNQARGHDAATFELSIALVALPAAPQQPLAAAGDTGGAP